MKHAYRAISSGSTCPQPTAEASNISVQLHIGTWRIQQGMDYHLLCRLQSYIGIQVFGVCGKGGGVVVKCYL